MRLLAASMLLAVSACANIGGGGFNAKPADVYSIMPTQDDVRSLMGGDTNWWAGPPSFEVRPLDAQTTPASQKFSVSQLFQHLGTAEELFARYTVFDKTSSASTAMTNLQTNLGPSPSSPKVGDQVLYYGAGGTGGAPYVTRTFVRVGQVILTLIWSRKDRGVTTDMLAKNARKFVGPLSTISKVHAKPQPVESRELPPPGLDVTLLGAAQVPVESFVVLSRTAQPDFVRKLMKDIGVTTLPYGDYALNNDTHMEVQTALLTLATASDADGWAKAFGPGQQPDSQGIYMGYIPTGGSPAAGTYVLTFAVGQYGGYLTCRSSIEGEAASRECEAPVHNTAVAWKLALGG